MQHQIVLERCQDRPVTIKAEVADTDIDKDMGTLPGCIGIHNQPEQGYNCSSCYHQELCRATTATPTGTIIVDKS